MSTLTSQTYSARMVDLLNTARQALSHPKVKYQPRAAQCVDILAEFVRLHDALIQQGLTLSVLIEITKDEGGTPNDRRPSPDAITDGDGRQTQHGEYTTAMPGPAVAGESPE